MKVYHVLGIRHQAVIFAASPDEAVAQAITPHQFVDQLVYLSHTDVRP